MSDSVLRLQLIQERRQFTLKLLLVSWIIIERLVFHLDRIVAVVGSPAQINSRSLLRRRETKTARIVGRREPCPAQRFDLLVGRPAKCGASETAGTPEPVGRRVDHVVAGGHGVHYTPPAALDRFAHQNPLGDGPPFGRRQLDIEAELLQQVFGDGRLAAACSRAVAADNLTGCKVPVAGSAAERAQSRKAR